MWSKTCERSMTPRIDGSAFLLQCQCQVDDMRTVIRMKEVPAIDAGEYLLQRWIDAVRAKESKNRALIEDRSGRDLPRRQHRSAQIVCDIVDCDSAQRVDRTRVDRDGIADRLAGAVVCRNGLHFRFDVTPIVILALDKLPVFAERRTVRKVADMYMRLMVEFRLRDQETGSQLDACQLELRAGKDRYPQGNANCIG